MIRAQYHFRKVGPDVLIWDVRKLLAKAAALPVEQVPLAEIREIDEAYWSHEAPLTCRDVLRHADQIAAADLAYPILLCPEGRVIDGMHRVMKALSEGRSTIAAQRLETLPAPDHRNMRADDLPYD